MLCGGRSILIRVIMFTARNRDSPIKGEDNAKMTWSVGRSSVGPMSLITRQPRKRDFCLPHSFQSASGAHPVRERTYN
jgi:hypothetical protein